MEPTLWTPTAVYETAAAFRTSRVLLSAIELGVFAALAGGERPAAELAAACGVDESGLNRLLCALAGMGLVERRGNRWVNTPAAQSLLVPSSPQFVGGLGHLLSLWQTWSTLTGAVRAGHRVVEPPAEGEVADRRREAFIAAMHRRAVELGVEMAAALGPEPVTRVLDIGAGSGAIAMAFLQAHPGATATLFDLPEVLPLTRGYVAAAGLIARVDYRGGDYLQATFGTGYDLAILSAVVHINRDEENADLVRRAAAALRPGGRLLIQDFVMSGDRTAPAVGALFSLNMLVGTAGGDTYTQAEMSSWLTRAGLGAGERIDLPRGTSLVVGRRP